MYTISCVLLSSNTKIIEIPLSHSENKKATQNTDYFRLSYRGWNCWVKKDVTLTVSQPVSKCTHRSITLRTFTEQRSHVAPSFTSIICFHPERGLIGQTKLLGKGKEAASFILQVIEIFTLVYSRSHVQNSP